MRSSIVFLLAYLGCVGLVIYGIRSIPQEVWNAPLTNNSLRYFAIFLLCLTFINSLDKGKK